MKLKYRIPTSSKYILPVILRYIAFVGLALAVATVFMGTVANATSLKLPESYPINSCGIIAKDMHTDFGTPTVFLQPNTYPDQIGHWINKFNLYEHTYYIDYANEKIFNSKKEVLDWYIQSGVDTGLFSGAVIIE